MIQQYSPTPHPHGLARARPLVFPHALMLNTPRSTFPTNAVDPLSRNRKSREAPSNFRPAFHVVVQRHMGVSGPLGCLRMEADILITSAGEAEVQWPGFLPCVEQL